MGYSPERKAAVLKRMLPPNNLPVRRLSQEEGISEATLHKWRAQARSKGQLLPNADAGPEGWTSRDKFAAVLETAALNDADLAEYCRQRGLFAEQIKVWRGACEQANDWERTSTARMVAMKRSSIARCSRSRSRLVSASVQGGQVGRPGHAA